MTSAEGGTSRPIDDLDRDQDRGLLERVRTYVETTVIPARTELDSTTAPETFPWHVVEPGCEMGLKGLPFPRRYGGSEASAALLVAVVEELARGDVGVAYFFKHNWRFARLALRLPESIRDDVVARICTEARYLPASATTEPETGSDNHVLSDDAAVGLRTSAVLDGDTWVLNGTKLMITNGRMAGIYFVSARTDPTVPVAAGVTMFAVPAGTPGLTFGEPYGKLGQRASIQADVHFSDCRIPRDHVVGEVGQAMAAKRQGANIASNVINAAMSVGVAEAAFGEAVRWATTRVQGGSLIYRHQLVARELGMMRTEIDAARSLTHQAARGLDDGTLETDSTLALEANVHASEMVVRIVRSGMELFGGRGMMAGWPMEKLMRDALTLQHGFGTNPLMLVDIGTRAAEGHLSRTGDSTG